MTDMTDMTDPTKQPGNPDAPHAPGTPPSDDLDRMLRQWHTVHADRAAAGRDRLMARLRAERAAKPRRLDAYVVVNGAVNIAHLGLIGGNHFGGSTRFLLR